MFAKQINQFKCDQIGHQDYPIQAICLENNCKQIVTVCMKCQLDHHSEHPNSIKFLNEIPSLINSLNQCNQINQQMNQLCIIIIDNIKLVQNSFQQRFRQLEDQFNKQNTLEGLKALATLIKTQSKANEVNIIQKLLIDISFAFKECIKQLDNQEPIKQSKELDSLINESLKHYIQASNLSRQCKYDDAFIELQKAIDLNFQNDLAWFYKGQLLSMRNCYHEALECFNNAIRFGKPSVHYFNGKGACLNSLNQLDEALTCYDLAIQVTPNESSYQNKGQILEVQQKFDEAILAYEQGLTINPKSSFLETKLENIKSKKQKQQS